MPTARLDDRATIAISGPDAETLLQNVLTTDVPAVVAAGLGYGALLTPQGKIVADLLLHRFGDGFVADIREETAEAFGKRLAMYRLRSKVTIAAAEHLAVFARWGAEDPTPSPSPQGGGGQVAPDPRLARLGERWVAPRESVACDASLQDYHLHRIALAVPEGGLDFPFGDTFPHDAAMDSLHGVAFEKGCYIGQEVVSRMRHRGTARRRVVAVTATGHPAGHELPAPGAAIVAGARELGRMGSSAGPYGIAIVRLDRLGAALDSGDTVLAGDAAVTVALPHWATYTMPPSSGFAE